MFAAGVEVRTLVGSTPEYLLAPIAGDHAGPNDLEDPERLEKRLERLDLLLASRDFDDVGSCRHVDDLPAEDVDDAQ